MSMDYKGRANSSTARNIVIDLKAGNILSEQGYIREYRGIAECYFDKENSSSK